jgi:hypothetical protein
MREETEVTEKSMEPATPIEWTPEMRAMYPKECISDSCDSSDPTMWRRGLCGVCYSRERTRIKSGVRVRLEEDVKGFGAEGDVVKLSWKLLEAMGQAAPLLPEHKDEIQIVDLSVTSEGVSAGMTPEELAAETNLT